MRFLCRKTGFSLVETLAVVAVVAVLVSITLGLGKHVKQQGNIKLTQSTIDILVTAVELYHQDEGKMPFKTGSLSPSYPFIDADFLNILGGSIINFNTTNEHTDPSAYPDIDVDGDGSGDGIDWSSEALYYFLSKSLNSRRIVNTINAPLVTTFDSARVPLNITVEGTGVVGVDMPRVVDAWGNALRYRYTEGNSFCVISSPGKDRLYGTADDINNR